MAGRHLLRRASLKRSAPSRLAFASGVRISIRLGKRPSAVHTEHPASRYIDVAGHAGSIESARTVWMHFGVCSIAQPHSSMRRLDRGEQARCRSDLLGGDPGDRCRPLRREIASHMFAQRVEAVRPARLTNDASYSSSPMMTLRKASASASSVPDEIAATPRRGAQALSRAGRRRRFEGSWSSASRTLKRVSPSGPEFSGLWPQNSIQRAGVPPVKSETGKSPKVRMQVLTRG